MIDLPDEPEWSRVADCIAPVSKQAERLGLEWLLVGAAARDVLLHHYRSAHVPRATLDADVAVRIAGWGELADLREALVRHEGARTPARPIQSVILSNGSTVDLIPFGSVARAHEIEWPESDGIRLDVSGFEEAMDSALTARLPGPLEVRVPTLVNMIALKLFAWRDRHSDRRGHDSQDLLALFSCLEAWLPDDSLYGEHDDALARGDYDPRAARMECLGDALGRTLHRESLRGLRELLAERGRDGAPSDLERELAGGGVPSEGWRSLLAALGRGLDR